MDNLVNIDCSRYSNKMSRKFFYILLVLIIFLGGYLRIVKLDSIPPHLGNDEISIAYDSYSMRVIGKDEHGNAWPLSFESHRSYKAPLYAYLNMPINWLLGNNEYGVRLLSAIFGTAAIVLIVGFGKFLNGDVLALFAALILAFNPKAIFVSRIGYESNVAYVVMSLGVLSMFYFLRKKKIFYALLAGLLLGLSIWGYHTEWGLAPMLAIVLPFLSRKEIAFKKWWPMWLVMVLVALPIFYDFVAVQRKDVNNRANSQLWFSAGQMQDYLKDTGDRPSKKFMTVALTPINNYLDHFSLDSMFSSGADMFNGESPLESGWFLLVCLPLLIIGLVKIKNIFGKYWSWILSWWLLCPIVPALTYGGVASVRNLAFIIPTILIMSGGALAVWRQSHKWSIIFVFMFVFNFFVFALSYYIHFPVDSGNNFQYGYKEAWEFIKPNIDQYDKVVVETRFGEFGQFTGVPHLYFGYFEAFSAEDMQNRVDINGTIGKFEFKYVDWNQEEYSPNAIYIVSAINPKAGKIADNLKELTLIRNMDFSPQFLIYETIVD